MQRNITRFESRLHWVFIPIIREDMKTPTIDERKKMLEDYATKDLQSTIDEYLALTSKLEFVQKQIMQTVEELTLDTVVGKLTNLKVEFGKTQEDIKQIDFQNEYAQTVNSLAPKIYD